MNIKFELITVEHPETDRKATILWPDGDYPKGLAILKDIARTDPESFLQNLTIYPGRDDSLRFDAPLRIVDTNNYHAIGEVLAEDTRNMFLRVIPVGGCF